MIINKSFVDFKEFTTGLTLNRRGCSTAAAVLIDTFTKLQSIATRGEIQHDKTYFGVLVLGNRKQLSYS